MNYGAFIDRHYQADFLLAPSYLAGRAARILPKLYLATTDNRYFVAHRQLWRKANPGLPEDKRVQRVGYLMQARRSVGQALRKKEEIAETAARQAVDAAKRSLGQRGRPWQSGGVPDYNRRMACNMPHAQWFAVLGIDQPTAVKLFYVP